MSTLLFRNRDGEVIRYMDSKTKRIKHLAEIFNKHKGFFRGVQHYITKKQAEQIVLERSFKNINTLKKEIEYTKKLAKRDK